MQYIIMNTYLTLYGVHKPAVFPLPPLPNLKKKRKYMFPYDCTNSG